MAEKESGYWFTTETGVHVHVGDGETPEQAINRRFREGKEYRQNTSYKDIISDAKKETATAAQEMQVTDSHLGKGKEYRQNTPYEELTKSAEQKSMGTEEVLTDKENETLDTYQIPKEPVVRQEKDAKKWAQYDKDYEDYKQKEPQITADMDSIAKQTGMPLIGREHRLKGKGSYDRKVNDKRLNGEYKPLGDVVRYTFEHPFENAPNKINENLDLLRKKGYNIVAVDNKWKDDGAYNGINVDVISPSGVPMEIQYMTRNNHDVKEAMHKYYEISRDSRTPAHIKELADKKMKELASMWEIPKGIKEV